MLSLHIIYTTYGANMFAYHAEDTPINLYLYLLRNEMYKAIGVGMPKYQVSFEDKFYDILNNGTDRDMYILGSVMYIATCESLINEKPIHLQDLLEELKLRLIEQS